MNHLNAIYLLNKYIHKYCRFGQPPTTAEIINEWNYEFNPPRRHQGVNRDSIIKIFRYILRHQRVSNETHWKFHTAIYQYLLQYFATAAQKFNILDKTVIQHPCIFHTSGE